MFGLEKVGEWIAYKKLKGEGNELWKVRKGTTLLVDTKKYLLLGDNKKRVIVVGSIEDKSISERGIKVQPSPLGSLDEGVIRQRDLPMFDVKVPRTELRIARKRQKSWIRRQNASFHWGPDYQ